MSCMRPQAPFGETARWSKSDSARIIALTSANSTPYRAATAWIRPSYVVGSAAGREAPNGTYRGGSVKNRDGRGGLLKNGDRGGSVKNCDGVGGFVKNAD